MVPFISSIYFFLFITFILPLSISQAEDDYRYPNCSQDFDCGRIKDIGYPFWGDHCGQPFFKINCPPESDDNGYPELQIGDQRYKVLAINETDQTLHIVLTDSCRGNYCPTVPILCNNTTHPPTLFLHLFYGCPPLTKVPNPFSCSASNRQSDATILRNDGSNLLGTYPELAKCHAKILIPVLEQNLSTTTMVAEAVINTGFEFYYKVRAELCDKCVKSGGRCGYDDQTVKYLQCSCTTCEGKKHTGTKIAIAAIVAGTLITVATIAVLCWYFRKKSNTSMILWKRKAKNVNIVETFLRDYGLLPPQLFKYKYVKKITSSFKDRIGQGGFGSVFKGKLPDGRLVAVKILSETKGNGTDFINEVATISRTSHVNIVSLLGFCVQGTKRALIYEFMPNGSLEKFIYDTPLNAHAHLGWETLYKIAIGIARGLEYLHRGCNTRILHFDIKPHNILLDQDFNPKIADFGLSKLCHLKESQVSMTGARGTAGYIAPEMISRNFGVVSHKADVYSYGMMVLEMVGGRKNIDVRVTNVSEVYFPHWIYNRLYLNEDLGLHEIYSLEDQEIARKMILVGLWCIQIDSVNRPPMSRVLDMLEGSHDALQLPPKPFLTSPPREEVSSSSLSKVFIERKEDMEEEEISSN